MIQRSLWVPEYYREQYFAKLTHLMTQGTDLGAFRWTLEAGESFVDHVRELAVVEVAEQVNIQVLERSIGHEVDKVS